MEPDISDGAPFLAAAALVGVLLGRVSIATLPASQSACAPFALSLGAAVVSLSRS